MTLTDRDRKLLLLIVPVVVLAAYWFLVLGPKRDAASVAKDELSKQEARLDVARSTATTASGAQSDFETDFAEIVRLGKAIPASVDMPSLIVQLDSAAEGTGIRFTKIATGERMATPAPAPAATDSSSSPPVEAGGAGAQSAPGTAVESANNAQQTADQRSSAAEQSGVDPADTQTSTSSGGGLAVGGGTAASGTQGAAGATTVAGLETVPLELEFVGDFFKLADFFHSVKRFVRVANQNVLVGGRLLTVESMKWSSDPQLFPQIKAEIKATVYLSPKAQGTTAGATPQGPTPDATTPAGTTASDGSTPVPTATATR